MPPFTYFIGKHLVGICCGSGLVPGTKDAHTVPAVEELPEGEMSRKTV